MKKKKKARHAYGAKGRKASRTASKKNIPYFSDMSFFKTEQHLPPPFPNFYSSMRSYSTGIATG